jgi:hypothetical protein
MKTKTTLTVLVIAAISLAAMGSIGTIASYNGDIGTIASAQNTTAGAVDTSNMTTFEENATSAVNDTASDGMTNSTG